MGKLIVVAASALSIAVAALALRQPWISLAVGVLVGSYFFLGALSRGSGIADARVTRLPGEVRKPGDPAISIGMGLAAAGIAAPYMVSRDPNLTSALHYWYYAIFAAGLLIALWNAGKTLLAGRRSGNNAGSMDDSDAGSR